MPTLELKDIAQRRRGGGGAEGFALRDINLSLGPGDFVSISGESGAGKSPLPLLMTCLLPPDGGMLLHGGKRN